MIMKILKKSIGITLIFIYSVLFGAGEKLTIFELTPGGRGTGIGGAYQAIVDDSTATFWNPAGLSDFAEQNLSISYQKVFGDYTFWNISYGLPVLGIGTFAAGVAQFSSGDIIGVGEHEEELPVFSESQTLFSISYGAPLISLFRLRNRYLKLIDIGATLKIVHVSIYEYSGTGVGLDVGAKFRPAKSMNFWNLFNFAFQIKNLVPPGVKLISERDWNMPELNFATSAFLFYNMLSVNTSFSLLLISPVRFDYAFGLEFQTPYHFSIRTGYNGNFSFGVGTKIKNFSFDYALIYNSYLGLSHQISVQLNFGTSINI